MTQHARRDGVAPAARRAHRRGELHVRQLSHGELAAVVPAAVVHPLAQELDGRLRAVLLELGHVEVVDKHHGALADGRAEDALAPLVQLGVDDVLHGVGAGLRGEGALDVLELGLVARVQRLSMYTVLPVPVGPPNSTCFPVVHEQVEQKSVAHRVDVHGDDDVQKLAPSARVRGTSTVATSSQFFQRPISLSKCRSYTVALACRGEGLGQLVVGVTRWPPGRGRSRRVRASRPRACPRACGKSRRTSCARVGVRRRRWTTRRRTRTAVNEHALVFVGHRERLVLADAELVDHGLEDVHQRHRQVDVGRRHELLAVLAHEAQARLDQPREKLLEPTEVRLEGLGQSGHPALLQRLPAHLVGSM